MYSLCVKTYMVSTTPGVDINSESKVLWSLLHRSVQSVGEWGMNTEIVQSSTLERTWFFA